VLAQSEKYEQEILGNYTRITCENEMKPDALLDRNASQEGLPQTYLAPAVSFERCMPAIEYALANDMEIRFHTLVWHSQTPKWFFTEDYTDGGQLVSKEVMLARMESYIKTVLTYFDENYPGLIYAVDVVNESFDVGNGDEYGVRMKDNLWYETVGQEYYYHAFVFARKYAPDYMKLFYNDYGCADKVDLILENLAPLKAEGLIDGIGMQSHLSTSDNIQYKFMLAVKEFCNAGYEVQATELDIGVKEQTENAFKTQGRKYRVFFEQMKKLQEEGYPITGITLWGISDGHTWRSDEYPLLYDKEMNKKPAYLGAMLDKTIAPVE
jgi:GH35 family endo-1,4-beta-xylanase